ncbi:MAG TPA: SAM-dependent methyltransferase [Firmicutes bacterium]|nr:SAM-dependent methyltransferase [Bacillota bacterium]
MQVTSDFKEYKLLDTSNGEKLESWNGVILRRPDPEVIWPSPNKDSWKADASYVRSERGGGSWTKGNNVPDVWQIHYKDLTFNLKLMGFKHTGLFPEQASNWDIIIDRIKSSKRDDVKVLNLFAYTGGASIAALSAGASVVHVDSSRGMVEWAKENAKSSGLEDKPIRYIVDDVKKFVKREIRRENKYDIIIMDPPSFGRGSSGEVWNIETDLYDLVSDASKLLSDDPIMFLINSYTTGLSMSVLENILLLTVDKDHKGSIVKDEIGIKVEDSNIVLPCGLFVRWETKK